MPQRWFLQLIISAAHRWIKMVPLIPPEEVGDWDMEQNFWCFKLNYLNFNQSEFHHIFSSTVFILSISLCILSSFGIICSVLLLIKPVVIQQSNVIIFWLCIKGVSIFHQIFLNINICSLTVDKLNHVCIKIIIFLWLGVMAALEIIFIYLFAKHFQNAEVLREQAHQTAERGRDVTVAELLGDMEYLESNIRIDPVIHV